MPTLNHRQGVSSSRLGFQCDALPFLGHVPYPRVHDVSRTGYVRRPWRVPAGNNMAVDGQEGLISDPVAPGGIDRPGLAKASKSRHGSISSDWSVEPRAKGSASSLHNDLSEVEELEASQVVPPQRPHQQNANEQMGTVHRRYESNRWKHAQEKRSRQRKGRIDLASPQEHSLNGPGYERIPTPARPATHSKGVISGWEPYRAQALQRSPSQKRTKHPFKDKLDGGDDGSRKYIMSAGPSGRFGSTGQSLASKKGLEVFTPDKTKEKGKNAGDTILIRAIGDSIPVSYHKQIRHCASKVRRIIASTMQDFLALDSAPSVLSTYTKPLIGGRGGSAVQCQVMNVMLDPSSLATVAKNQIIHDVKQMMNDCLSDSLAEDDWTVLDVDGTMDHVGNKANRSLGIDVLGCFLVLLRPEDKRIPVLIFEILREANIEQAKDTVEIYNYLLHGCDMEGYGALATKVLEVMKGRGVTPDLMSYTWAIGAYSRMPDQQAAEDVFMTLKSKGFDPSTLTYNKLLYCAAQGCEWEAAMNTYEDMKANNVQRDVLTYRYLVIALINCHKDKMALKCIEWIAADDVVTDWRVFSTLLQHFFLKRQDLATALNIISSAQGFGISLRTRAISDIIMRSKLNAKSLVRLVEYMRETGVMQSSKPSADDEDVLRVMYSKLLRGLGSTDDCIKDAFKVRQWMDDDEVELDTLAYSLFSNFVCSPSQANQCWLLYETAKKIGKHEHPIFIKNVSHTMSQSGNWERIHIVFQDALNAGQSAQELEGLLTRLINTAGRLGHYTDAETLFEKACQHDIASPRLYDAIIRCSQKDPQKCLDLFQRMNKAEIQGEKWTYETLVKAAARRGLIEEMRMVWQSMVSAGYVPSVQLYNHLIQGFAAAGMEDEAFKVYWKMQEPITNFENVNFQSLCEVRSNQFSRYHVTSHSLKLWMVGMKMQPSLVTRATAVEKSAEDVKWKEVIKLYDEQKPYQACPMESTFISLLDVSRQNKSAKRLSVIEQGMEEFKIYPNNCVLDAAVQYYTALGELDKAMEMFRKARKSGTPPSSALWVALIRCCGHQNVHNGWERALDLFSRAQKEGIPLTSSLFNVMIEVCIAKHKTGAVINMLQRMRSHQHSPGTRTYNLILSYLIKNHEWHLASVLLLDAIQQGEIEGFTSSKPNTIDLHQMTESIAQVAMRLWLQHLRQDAKKGIFLNDSCIEVVLGEEEDIEDGGATRLRSVITNVLSGGEIGAKIAPTAFVPAEDSTGALILMKLPFYDWLQSSDIDLGLDDSFDTKKLDLSANFSD